MKYNFAKNQMSLNHQKINKKNKFSVFCFEGYSYAPI